MANNRLTKNISFSDYEREIYDYLQAHKNASRLVKHLVAVHMLEEKKEISIMQTMKKSNIDEIAITKEPEEKNKQKEENKKEEVIVKTKKDKGLKISKNEEKLKNAIKELPL